MSWSSPAFSRRPPRLRVECTVPIPKWTRVCKSLLHLAQSRGSGRVLFGDGPQQAPADFGDFRHSLLKGFGIGLGRLMKAADLADKLPRRGVQLFGRCGF